MKVLNIIASAYRATLEEQDDTIVWLSHALRGAGAQVDLLLRGNAVNCAARGQDASGLAFGRWKQTQPPRIEHDLASLVAKGAALYALREDLDARGLGEAALIEGVQAVTMQSLPALMAGYARIWHW